MKILLTGSAGFIGFHVSKFLLERGDEVVGIDNFNDYYEVSLKENRNKILEKYPNYKLYKKDICNLKELEKIFSENKIQKIVHLAARAGVRSSILDPLLYEEVNIKGTNNLLEIAKDHKVENFVFASSSSVYGGNKKIPFSETDSVDHPISPYAASKKAGELLCYTYHHLYKLNISCHRFFTVYGPWGRPDMALFLFTKAILEGKKIDVYNHGKMKRDFTYVDDIVQGIISSLDKNLKYEIFNLGNSNTVELEYFISIIEKELRQKANKNYMPIQPGDVPATFADISKAKQLLDFNPKTKIEQGIKNFIKWYKSYYLVS